MWRVHTCPSAPPRTAAGSPGLITQRSFSGRGSRRQGSPAPAGTCRVVLVVVYDVGDGAEGVLLGQEELPRVVDFDLVMSDVATDSVSGEAGALLSVVI